MEDTAELVPLVYENILDGYYINRLGEIYSARRWGELIKLKSHPSTTRGYLHISLRVEDRRSRMFCVHVLVCATFHEKPNDEGVYHACHRNGNKLDCRASNMYWGTPSQNMLDREAHRRAAGRQHPRAKLSVEQVKAIRKRIHDGESIKALARELGMSDTYLGDLYKGKFWDHIPLDYEPKDLKTLEKSIAPSKLMPRETVLEVYRRHFIDGLNYADVSRAMNGVPHKVTVGKMCKNELIAYKSLFEEFQNEHHRCNVGA